MARVTVTPTTLPAVSDADGTVITWTACVVADKEQFALTGNEVLLVYNSGASSHNITVSSIACSHGRTQTTTKAMGAGTFLMFQRFPLEGWQQADGNLYFEGDSAELKYIVLRLA